MAIQLQTIGIVAKDMKATLDFYRILGLPIPESVEDEPNVDYQAPNGITLGFLSEDVAKAADPNYKDPSGQTMNLQFLVDSPAEVDVVYQRLTEAGYASYAQPWDAFWGQRFARVADPDGRVVNIYAYLNK